MKTNSANVTATSNPYESPRATPTIPRRQVVAQAMEWLRILAFVVFALATLAGAFLWDYLKRGLGAQSIFDRFPHPPVWVLHLLFYSMRLGTPSAVLLLTLVCRRISFPLWIVIGPLLLFDISVNALWHGPRWLFRSCGFAMLFVTAGGVLCLPIIWRKVPLHFWLVLVPALCFDVWFLWWWLTFDD